MDKVDAPVCDTLMGKGAYDGREANYTGMLGMHGARSTNFILQEADLLIVLAHVFDDRAIGKTEQFCPSAKIIHVDIDARNWVKSNNRTWRFRRMSMRFWRN